MNFEQQRIQRLELDLAVANARLISEREMLHERSHEKLRHAVHRMEELREERDNARDLVARLWDETCLCPAAQWHTTFQGVPHAE